MKILKIENDCGDAIEMQKSTSMHGDGTEADELFLCITNRGVRRAFISIGDVGDISEIIIWLSNIKRDMLGINQVS